MEAAEFREWLLIVLSGAELALLAAVLRSVFSLDRRLLTALQQLRRIARRNGRPEL